MVLGKPEREIIILNHKRHKRKTKGTQKIKFIMQYVNTIH
jgi:hypothetical protein